MKFILLFLFPYILFAQEILTLEKALDIALNESFKIKSANLALENSQKSLEAVRLGLLSKVDLEFDLPNYFSSLSSRFNPLTEKDEFYKLSTTQYEGRLFVTQPIIFTNGTLSLIGSIYQRKQFLQGSNDVKDYYTNLSIRLNQPLFTFNTMKANYERAKINLESSKRDYTNAERDLILQVKTSFYRLYEANQKVEIQKRKLEQSEISYNTALNKYKAGLIAEVEKMQLEVDLATSKNQFLDAQRNYQEQLNEFKYLIGLSLDSYITLKTELDYNPINIDLDEFITQALKNRTEIKNAEDRLILNEMTIDEIDDQRKIKLNLTANYGINKNDTELKYLFKEFEDDRSVKVTMKMPVFDWGKNDTEVEAAVANYKLSKERLRDLRESIKKEIISAVYKIESAKARVEVLSKSVLVARKSYEISLERFKVGKITSFDLTQMQLKLTDTELNNLSALIDYKIAVANLERKTLMKFD